MRVVWESVWFGWVLYGAGLLTVFLMSEMTRSFEFFLAVYAVVGLLLLGHREAAGSRIALPVRDSVLPIDVALFALLWPMLASVALLVMSMASLSRRSVALNKPA